MDSFVQKLNRKKYISFDTSALPRVLTLLDLTALGIGSTVGVGFYILAGEVARNIAGPAVTICFLIAGIASVFAGLCYAEFGARVPKAGSAYVYSYVCVGEFVAFIIGWNLILEYVIGTASVARGYSAYVDNLANYSISNAFREAMPMNVNALSPYPDFFAFGITLLLACVLSIGVKESSRANNVFTGINIFVITYVIIAGATLADPSNWSLSADQVDPNSTDTVCTSEKGGKETDNPWGDGGFVPYGFNGIMQGAATCFFGFVGFDVIATTGEEALRPARNIPLSISISLLCIFLAYFGMSTVLTLALPYCMEDPNAPLIELFKYFNMDVSKWIVSVGAIFGFSASLLGAMFPMPRIIYAMADDGILFRFLARVNKRFKTPLIATWLSGFFAGIMALLFDLNALVDMMSIGTLMAYTIVSVCVMLLRYASDSDNAIGHHEKEGFESNYTQKNISIQFSFSDYIGQMFNSKRLKDPTELSSSLVNYTTLSYCLITFLLALFLTLFGSRLVNGDVGIIILIVIFVILTLLNLFIISRQPMSSQKLTFKVPLVPWIPALSAFINLYLMCNLSTATWIRFVVWMAIGLLIYFLYGIRKSTGSQPPPLSSVNGKDNLGLKDDMWKEKIPPIIVEPPTPMLLRLESQTSLIRPPQPRRQSIIDNSFVGVQINNNQKVHNTQVNDKSITVLKISETTSQSADISKLSLESKSEPSSESDYDEEEEGSSGSHDKKVSSTTVVTSASVYASDDPSNYHEIPKEESTFVKSSSDSNYQDIEYVIKDELMTENQDSSDKNANLEPIYAVVDKSTKTKHQPHVEHENVIGNTANGKEISDEGSESFHKLVAAKSSSLPLSMSVTVSSSEPTSPKMNRHPFKILRRASSFDNIPPSLPDSPLARRVNNFIIIPVKVPQEELKLEEISNNQLKDDLNVRELNMRLNKLEEVNKYEVNTAIDVGSKVDSTKIGTNVIEKDYLQLSPLDTIRERGESQLVNGDYIANGSIKNEIIVNPLPNQGKAENKIENFRNKNDDLKESTDILPVTAHNNINKKNDVNIVSNKQSLEDEDKPIDSSKPRSLIQKLLIDAQPFEPGAQMSQLDGITNGEGSKTNLNRSGENISTNSESVTKEEFYKLKSVFEK